MRRALAVLVALVVIAAVAAGVALYVTRPTLPTGPQAFGHENGQAFTAIERGKYLTKVADCAACHTNPHGGQPFAGGRAIETPFGEVVASNITPDSETGIGTWTDQDFVNALQRGFAKGGHMIYPAMPYTYFTRATPADINAIHAYLRTVTPVHHTVVSNRLPFPFDIRLGMRLWNALYFKPGHFHANPLQSADWNRGAYLVTGLEHCGACHTPKTIIGGDEGDEAFQGYATQGWYAPNITNDRRRGLGDWSVADVVSYLRTGHNRQGAASGPMAEEVALSSSGLCDGDLKAMAVYLKSLPGQDDQVAPVSADDPMMAAGKAIYDDTCAICHKADGSGLPRMFPTLRDSPSVQSREATSLLRVVLDGAKSVSTAKAPTGAAMPSYGWQLRNDQIAAVLTYIRNSWGNAAPTVSAHDVAADLRWLLCLEAPNPIGLGRSFLPSKSENRRLRRARASFGYDGCPSS